MLPEVIDDDSSILNASANKKVDSFSIDHVAVPNHSGVGHEPDHAFLVGSLRIADQKMPTSLAVPSSTLGPSSNAKTTCASRTA